LKFKITGQNTKPVNANLSAVFSETNQSECQHCDIRNYLYFHEFPSLENIDLSIEHDTIFSLIDNMLIASGGIRSDMLHSARSDKNKISFTKAF